MNADAVVTLACFLALQTGGFIFFAGSIREVVRELQRAREDHEERLRKLEQRRAEYSGA